MNIIIAAIILVAYTLFAVAWARRIPNSLSQSVLDLPEWGKTVWTVVIVAVAFLTVPTFIERTADYIRFMAFIACGALAFVAVTPLAGRRDLSYNIHMTAAYVCGFGSQIAVVVTCPWYVFAWAPWLFTFVWLTKDPNGTWPTRLFWAEMTCFAVTLVFSSL